jgi:hypothetical protein
MEEMQRADTHHVPHHAHTCARPAPPSQAPAFTARPHTLRPGACADTSGAG